MGGTGLRASCKSAFFAVGVCTGDCTIRSRPSVREQVLVVEFRRAIVENEIWV
jgi:hypothetical protein